MHIHNIPLDKRDVFGDTGAARWAFFGIFIVVILIIILGTFRVNKKRGSNGLQPLYGTRWMTPPSYVQSQTQYNQPTRRNQTSDQPANYVPTYTATANDQDMGFYDQNGEFHENPNMKPSYNFDNDNPIVSEPTHQRTTSQTDGVPIHPIEEDLDDLVRPTGPPPRTSTASQLPTTNNTRHTTEVREGSSREGSSQETLNETSQPR